MKMLAGVRFCGRKGRVLEDALSVAAMLSASARATVASS